MNVMGMGWQEIMIILVGALIIFGPNKLPEVAGQVGKAVRDFRKMTSELTGEIERTAGVGDIKAAVQKELGGIQSQVNSATSSVSKTMSSATSTVNSAAGSKSTSTVTAAAASKPATSAATAAAKPANPAPVVASKKDPLAGVSFMDEPKTPTNPASAKASSETKPTATIDQLDAVGRARQRRAAAGYNRHATP